eukprot:257937-Chlamydomonas_euryale.AAC.2
MAASSGRSLSVLASRPRGDGAWAGELLLATATMTGLTGACGHVLSRCCFASGAVACAMTGRAAETAQTAGLTAACRQVLAHGRARHQACPLF